MEVDVVIPTWKRPEKLARCLASLKRQTLEHRLHVVEDTAREYAIGIWNRLAPRVEGAFVYLCDDVELEPHCLELARAALLERWPDSDGVVGFHQQNIQGKAGTAQSAMGMIGPKFLDRFEGRRPFCPDYRRFHFDSELGLYARSVKRFHFCEAARLTHYHPAHYPKEMDTTHTEVRNPALVAQDKAVWDKRRKLHLLWGHSARCLLQ